MKVFFTASYTGKIKYQKKYDLIKKILLGDSRVDLIFPEIGNYKSVLSPTEKNRLKDENYLNYEAIRKGILVSDAVIIEISNEDFQLGHEATYAINNRIPLLCLSVNEDFSKKIKNRYFHANRYNSYNVESYINSFIERVLDERLSERMNFFMSKRHDRYPVK